MELEAQDMAEVEVMEETVAMEVEALMDQNQWVATQDQDPKQHQMQELAAQGMLEIVDTQAVVIAGHSNLVIQDQG